MLAHQAIEHPPEEWLARKVAMCVAALVHRSSVYLAPTFYSTAL